MCLVFIVSLDDLVYQNEHIALVISLKCEIYFSLEMLS